MPTPRILKIGRDPSNDHVLTHVSISRYHVEVFINEEGLVFVTDLRSSNGTFINGKRLSGSTLLQPGDILKLGAERPVKWQEWTKDVGRTSNSNGEQENSILDLSQPLPAGFFERYRSILVAFLIGTVAIILFVLIYLQSTGRLRSFSFPKLGVLLTYFINEPSRHPASFNSSLLYA